MLMLMQLLGVAYVLVVALIIPVVAVILFASVKVMLKPGPMESGRHNLMKEDE